MVPTTAQTPYRRTNKSVGIQNTPRVNIPLSQEPEIPETPEVIVPPKTPATHTSPAKNLRSQSSTTTPAVAPVADRRMTLPPICENSVVVAPPPAAEIVEQPRIYPDLDNVQQQQSELPHVIAQVTADFDDVIPCTQATPQQVPKTPSREATRSQIVLMTPRTPARPPSAFADPMTTPRRPASAMATPKRKSWRVTAAEMATPEQIMEIIHGPQTTTAAATRAEETMVTRATPSLRVISPQTLNVQTPRQLVAEMRSHSPSVIIPETQAVDTETAAPEEAEVGEETTIHDGHVEFNDYSVQPVIATPVLKQFKLPLADCMDARNAAADDTSNDRTTTSNNTVAKGNNTTVAKSKSIMKRASELTIPKDSDRSSIVVPSSQKRRLHSAVRDLTPIRSPVVVQRSPSAPIDKSKKSSSSNDSVFVKPQEKPKRAYNRKKSTAVSQTIVEPPPTQSSSEDEGAAELTRNSSRTSSRSTNRSTRGTSNAPDSEGENAMVEKRKRRPGPKSKTQRQPSTDTVPAVVAETLRDWESDEPTADPPETRRDTPEYERVAGPSRSGSSNSSSRSKNPSPTENVDDVIFKVPAVPVPKRRGRKKKEPPVVSSNSNDSMDSNVSRRSQRTIKPITQMLPYCIVNEPTDHKKRQVTMFTLPTFEVFCNARKNSSRAVEENDLVEKDNKTADKYDTNKKSKRSESVTPSPEKKRAKSSSKAGVKKQKKVSKDELFNQLKDKSVDENVEEDQVLRKSKTKAAEKKQRNESSNREVDDNESHFTDVPEFQQPEPLPVIQEDDKPPKPARGRPKSKKTKADHLQVPRTTPKNQSLAHTYQDFSPNQLPASSTGVEVSLPSISMVTITKTLDIASFTDINEDRVLKQNFEGGKLMTYPDYSKGIISLHAKKQKARVKKKPLILNVVSGTLIVNLLSEQRAVRLTELDEISIPVGMWYSLENIGDQDAVLMFTWT